MSEEIIKVLDDLADRFGIAVDWTSQNVMPMLQQLFNRMQTYGIAIHTFAIVICAIGIIASVIYFILAYKSYRQCSITMKDNLLHKWHNYQNQAWLSDTGITCMIIASSIFSVSFIAIFYNSVQLIKCIILPELYVLNYITDCISVN